MGSKLKQLIIIHRHGARYPLKEISGDLSWPTNEQFWINYSGQLTPEGVLQLINIGTDLRLYYSEFISKINTHSIRVHASNSHRTATSAWSFLMGMFPNESKYFKYIDIQNKINSNIPDHIGIHIETQKKTDKLFNLGKSKKSEYLKKNLESSTLLKQLAVDDNYKNLCDKVYKITQSKNLCPSLPMVDRLIELKKKMHTQVKIAIAHNLEILPNTVGEKFTEGDLRDIDILGNEIKKCYYMPGNELVTYNSGGSCASYLLNEIFRYIIGKKYQLIELSGHNTTLLSLASLLEIKITIPEFASYFLFEVYDNTIRVYYNPDPSKYLRKDLINKRWGKSNIYQDWNTIPEGEFSINEFGERYNLYKLQKIYSLISKIKSFK